MITILVGIVLSMILNIGKRLNLSNVISIQYAAIIGSLIIAAVSYYAEVNMTLNQYIETLLIIFTSATTTYEVIIKRLNPDSLMGKIIGNSK